MEDEKRSGRECFRRLDFGIPKVKGARRDQGDDDVKRDV